MTLQEIRDKINAQFKLIEEQESKIRIMVSELKLTEKTLPNSEEWMELQRRFSEYIRLWTEYKRQLMQNPRVFILEHLHKG